MSKKNLRERPIKIRKENIMKVIDGLLMFFDDNDSDDVFVEGLPSYMRLWIGQDSKGVISFLENQKVIEIKKFKKAGRNRGLIGVRKDALVNKANLIALKKDMKNSLDKFVQIGRILVWGKGKRERRSRLS
ncbi:MAG: hypothetical protein QGG63_00645 [Candidatus Pacebacteria bacterium]|jgi:hypothetical protein|nr:hypothetical protein [Candidatus Paceibacterota bacterium]|tara:strand:- start:31597 stop:31989 length:393 start_codon:yes stop_codon:yes gene_type:complete